MKKRETTKLFYDLYAYKLVLKNSLAPIFRSKNLSHARQVLDNMQTDYEEQNVLKWKRVLKSSIISYDHFSDAKILLNLFSKANDDYRIRVEYSNMCVYSNDISWLNTIASKINSKHLRELWEPDSKYLADLQTKNTIIIEGNLPYEYKVTLGPRGNPQFAEWARNNKDKIKAGNIFLSELEHNGYVNGMYFYVRDEKILTLVKMILGHCIRRIDKIVHK